MRKLLLSIAVILSVLTAAAQTSHLHIYRNDNKFTTAKASEIEKIEFFSSVWGDSGERIRLISAEGDTELIPVANIDSVVMGHNIPFIKITLTDYPNLEDLIKTAPFDKTTIYKATIEMVGNGLYDDLPSTEVEFRGRGNSTWNMPKTPYRFKFAKKQSVCGLEKAKTYALIANYIDCTLMRNVTALHLASMIGMPYVCSTIPVNVELNGHYRGSYFLTEKIGIGKASVDIDETKGMLFELDSNYDEDYKFRYYFNEGWTSLNLPVMVKDPDLTELAGTIDGFNPTTYFNSWKADMSKMLDAVTTRKSTESLSDVLDVQSAIDYVFVYLVTGNMELKHPKSCYLWKESLDPESRYHFGPVWDFDWAFTYDSKEGSGKYDGVLLPKNGNCGGASFFKMLVKNNEIRAGLEKRMNEYTKELWPRLKEYLDEYASLIEPSAKMNGMIWERDGSRGTYSSFDFRKNYANQILWMENRIKWINSHPNLGLY